MLISLTLNLSKIDIPGWSLGTEQEEEKEEHGKIRQ